MTICISAIAEEKYIVSISDKMVTLTNPPTEYEQYNSKTHVITNSCIFASAGLALEPLPILEEIKEECDDKTPITDIATKAKTIFKKHRTQFMEDNLLTKFGLTHDEFKKMQLSMNPNIVAQIYKTLNEKLYDLSIIIAGVDKNGPHIFNINDPSQLTNYNGLGHCQIGSGNIHAFSSFISNQFNSKLKLTEVAAIVYESKKRSEIARGVGVASDMYIVSNNNVKQLTDDEMKNLESNYQCKIERQNENINKSRHEANEIKFDT